MELANRDEYNNVRTENLKIQECITEYMKPLHDHGLTPYPISFALFVTGAGLSWGWLLVMKRMISNVSFAATAISNIDILIVHIIIQTIVVIYILLCWLGMCGRMYRLCDPQGDRTIEAYMYRFNVPRDQLLKPLGRVADWSAVPPPHADIWPPRSNIKTEVPPPDTGAEQRRLLAKFYRRFGLCGGKRRS